MKKLSITLTAFSMLAMFSCNNADKHNETAATPADSAATAEKAEAAVPKEPMDSAAMAKAWEAYMTPGAMHKVMANQDGKWNAELTFWSGPNAGPSPVSKATVENKMIMGGRYQISDFHGEMMGMPFEGHQTTAYDNAKKKFISTWIDNTGTGMMYMEGTYDEATKKMNFEGKMIEPATGQEYTYRQVVTDIDDKTQTFEMYETKGGPEYKSMEIKLARK